MIQKNFQQNQRLIKTTQLFLSHLISLTARKTRTLGYFEKKFKIFFPTFINDGRSKNFNFFLIFFEKSHFSAKEQHQNELQGDDSLVKRSL